MTRSHSRDSAEAVQLPDMLAAALPPKRRGPKPGSEAAKHGGQATRDKWGVEHFRRIGALGGAMVRKERGPEFYKEMGRRGGEATRRKLGTEHYARIGRIGGRRKPKRPTALAESEEA